MALAAEFQGYCRELHDECLIKLVSTVEGAPEKVVAVFGGALWDRRGLDRNNATVDTVKDDFNRLGVEMWTTLQESHRFEYQRWRSAVVLISEVRNAVVHSVPKKLKKLEREGALTPAHWAMVLASIDELVVAHGTGRRRILGVNIHGICLEGGY